MNIKLIRFLDHYIGIVICLLLSLVRPFLTKRKSDNNSRLIIELSEMGSAILLIPIIAQIKKDDPSAKIYFLIFKKHAESVEICKLVDEVITIDDSSVINLMLSLPKVVTQLRKLKIKFLLDCELFSRLSTIITFFAGAENSSGFVAPKVTNLYRGNLYSHPFVYNNLNHITENYLGLWKAFSSDIQDLPYIKENLKDIDFEFKTIEIPADKKWKEISDNAVIFNPDPGLIGLRGWPIESYIELGKLLISKHNCQIVIVGLASANALAERCCKELGPKCISLAGKSKTLLDLLAIYSSAKLLITADSGPAHLAPLVNLPAIVLFGPESPIRFAPIGKKITTLTANTSCSPCLSAFNLRDSSCNNNICMKKISVGAVYEKVCQIL
jgi:ADP-heptose:LPS heptosyltransferase